MTILKHYRRGDILLVHALTLISTLPLTAFGWIPRLTTRYGNFQSCSTRRILLSYANKSNDDNDKHVNKSGNKSGDTTNNNGYDDKEEEDRLPLFSSEVDHQASVLKLEAIFNDIDTKDKSASLINSKDRVVLDSWMDWPCKGDSCGDGDEFDVSFF